MLKRFLNRFNPETRLEAQPTGLAAVRAQVDDSPGWTELSGRPHERDYAEVQALYSDALEAWRKNPIAYRIIAITTNYVVGDLIQVSSPQRSLNRFIKAFWDHPQNKMSLRLEPMCEELARAGDLFVLLFRNPEDGLSYIRFVAKDRIRQIETRPNDWETEIAYHEQMETGETRRWLAPGHPEAAESEAVMLHYAVNRPIGALLGESDLATMLPWLQRYSRMLEDRVRLHWAVRAFLWIVTVPTNKVNEKRAQYAIPPESGSIIVKDSGESWETATPNLRGADAAHDLQAVRGMVDAGSGYPPHWRGEGGEANLATATAMQAPTERHLLRRQRYFTFMLQDILYQACQRAVQIGRFPALSGLAGAAPDYYRLFSVSAPDISRSDNEALGRAARDLSTALQSLHGLLPGRSPRLARLVLKLVFRFAGEPQPEEVLEQIITEAANA